jgi:hypothetical protein
MHGSQVLPRDLVVSVRQYSAGIDDMSAFLPFGLGWTPDLPDSRDYCPGRDELGNIFRTLKPCCAVPSRVDWREFCPAVRQYPPAASGAANACVGLLQYFHRRATGEIIEWSSHFVDHTTQRLRARSLIGGESPHFAPWQTPPAPLSQPASDLTCAGGEQLRTSWKAIVRFGTPRIDDWPNGLGNVSAVPDAFAYAAAEKFPGMKYVSVDGFLKPAEVVLQSIRSFLAAGFALACGFSALTSLSSEADIPCATIFDGVRGGRAAMVVGYDDQHRVRSWQGAFLIQPFWGDTWGENGYGWLPYAYVLTGLALNFWTLVDSQWLASGEFARPV